MKNLLNKIKYFIYNPVISYSITEDHILTITYKSSKIEKFISPDNDNFWFTYPDEKRCGFFKQIFISLLYEDLTINNKTNKLNNNV